MSDVHEGGCVCGSVRYRTIGAPMLATVCHCTFCQKRTGSAFSEPVIFRMEQVEFSGGALTMYEHLSLSPGGEQAAAFYLREKGGGEREIPSPQSQDRSGYFLSAR